MRDHTYRANLLKRFGKDDGEILSPVRVLSSQFNRREQAALNELVESGEVFVKVCLTDLGKRSLGMIKPLTKTVPKKSRPKIDLDALPDSVSESGSFQDRLKVDLSKISSESSDALKLFEEAMKQPLERSRDASDS